MGKEKYVEMKGRVIQALPNATFKVELEIGYRVILNTILMYYK